MRSLLIGLSLLAGACTDGAGTAEPRQHLPVPEAPTFTLLVSNQSFDLETVDITARLDGQLAVTGDFAVEGQHTWIRFDFDLAPGDHTISLETEDGDTTLDQEFVMTSRNWGVGSGPAA
jgi:hypothetical protein